MKSSRYRQHERQKKESNSGIISSIKPVTAYAEFKGKNIYFFPKLVKNTKRTAINISYWRKFKNLYRPLIKALEVWFRTHAYRTTETGIANISAGFLAYLEDLEKVEITISEIDQALLNGFISWLNQAGKDGVARWSESTRARRYGATCILLEILQTLSEGKELADLKLAKNQWPGRHRRLKPVQGVGEESLRKLYVACVKEVAGVMDGFYRTKDLVVSHRDKIFNIPSRKAKEVYSDMGSALSAVDYYFPDHVFPSAKIIQQIAGTSLYTCLPSFHRKVVPLFVPTTRSIVPFVLLLSIHFAANTSSILMAELDEFQEIDVLGKKRLHWRGKKNRATRSPERSHTVTDEIDNPAMLLNFLKDYTNKLRMGGAEVTAPHIKSRLFLYLSENTKMRVGSYHNSGNMGGGDNAWIWPLKNFLKDNGLENINLTNLRQTIIDRVDDLTDGDIRARKVAAQHKSVVVTGLHYTSARVKKENHERIAFGIAQRERHTASNGLVDHRKNSENKSSATPGFHCADPYSSPLPDQKMDVLCKAFGMCPACPLASIERKSGRSAAQLMALRFAIVDAKIKVAPKRFLKIWAPVINKIDDVWLPSFTKKALKDAKKINLPELPSIE